MTLNLQEISDRIELNDLLVEYCHALDSQNWDAFEAVFTTDALLDYSQLINRKGTPQQMREYFEPRFAERLITGQHSISTMKITLDGDHATGKTVCHNPMLLRQTDGSERLMFVGVWYNDCFIRTQYGWKICKRVEENCWFFNEPIGFFDR